MPNNEKLAVQYFEQKEYEKANVYLDELYEKNNFRWYDYYFKSLVLAKDFSKAEKITKKLLKQNKQLVYLYVYLGRLYKLQNETKKEIECYDKAVKELPGDQRSVEDLARLFNEDRLYDYVIATYNKGRRYSPDYPYFYERAEAYKAKNNLTAMINEYLDALDFRDAELPNVQRSLQNSLGYDDEEGGFNNPLLKQELQKRIVKDPDKTVFSEFLIFIQIQQHDFDGAFVQSRALDKRFKEDGMRIFMLASTCLTNQAWEAALRCYEYLISKGQGHKFYEEAVMGSLNVEFLSLTSQPNPSKTDLLTLEQKLNQSLKNYQSGGYRGMLLMKSAKLKAYYLNKTDEAIQMLDEYIQQGGIDNTARAEVKMELADMYLLKGEIWEASLLYSQVEKEFKYETIGQIAKYKNAKLSFYAGDFTWAKAQADVLKGATTKLIANDALELSLVISDALGVDTVDAPLKLYSGAELMILQHRYSEALNRLDSVNALFSEHTLVDDIYYRKAQIYSLEGKYSEAEAMYKNVVEFFPEELYGDDAQFKLAELYQFKLLDKEKAKQAYQDVLTKYPGSIYSVEARKRFRELRGDQLSN